MSNKYIVKVKNIVDVFDLYPILTNMTGLTQNDIFNILYCGNGNGSVVWIDDIVIDEALERDDDDYEYDDDGYIIGTKIDDNADDFTDRSSTYKVYRSLEKLIMQNKLPTEFYIRIWW